MKVYIVIVWSDEGTEEMEVFQTYHAAVDFGYQAVMKENKRWNSQVIEKEVK